MISLYIGKRRQALFAFFLFFNVSLSYGANEHIRGARSVDCVKGYCMKMNSVEMQKSSIANIYAFGASDFQVFKGEEVLLELKGYEGSYDPSIQRYYLSKRSESVEYVVDLRTQKIITYKTAQ